MVWHPGKTGNFLTNKLSNMEQRITMCVNERKYFIYTGWPLMVQLKQLNPEIKLTANDPYPTFMFNLGNRCFLFNQEGKSVETMEGTFKAYSFNEVKDIREIFPHKEWIEGWE